ncbi:MAG: transporter [Lysobacterales bacterium]
MKALDLHRTCRLLLCCLVSVLLPVSGHAWENAYAAWTDPGVSKVIGTDASARIARDAGEIAASADAAQTDLPSSPDRQSRDDAWWTGPMLANSAETLPPGHFLIEPYLYDVHSNHTDGFGSRAYVLYGLVENLTVGLIPIVGYNKADGGRSSSRIGWGDIALQAQYRLTEFHEGSWFPTIALQLQEALPNGRYDRLGERPGDGFGSGVYATTLALNSQSYFWLPNGRILRMRFNVSKTFPGSASVQGVSVYGTGEGFRGHARPGNSLSVDASWEYSLTRRWVLALDATYTHNSNTHVGGQDAMYPAGALPLPDIQLESGSSEAFGLAPAIEYSWTPNLGVLLGTRVILGNRSTVATVTPAVAVNCVF